MNTRRTILPIVLGVFLLLVGFPYKASASIGAGSGSLSFGTVAIGASSTMSTSVTNNGDGAALLSITVTGSGYSLVSAPSSLQPGQSGTVTVRFAPATTGYLTGNVSIASPYGGTDISLNGTAVPAQAIISVSPSSLAFGSITVGLRSDEHDLTIRNTGSATLVGTATVSDAAFTLSRSDYTVAPGGSATIKVAFAPTTLKNYSATLTLTGGGGATVSLSGTATAPPKLSISLSSLDFGNVNLNGVATLYVTVTNTGGGTLTGSGSVNGTYFGGGGGYALAAGQSRQIAVQFSPLSPGYQTGSVTFTGGGGATVPLTATGINPLPSISVSPSSLAFGSLNAGQTSTKSVTIQNTYDGPVSVAIAATSPYSVSPSSAYLSVGQSTTLAVTFAPTSGGAFNESIYFTIQHSSTPDLGHSTLSVSGSGIASAQPVISVTPPSINYGDVAVGQSKTLGFTVTNVGTGTLSGNASLSAAGFTIISGGSYSLGAGQSTTVNVRFSPASAINYSGTVTFTGGGGAGRAVTGRGYVPGSTPAISVSPSSLDFGAVTLGGGLRDLSFTVTNIGGGTLTGSASISAAGFSIISSGTYNLAAGQSQTITVRFLPTSATQHTGTVTFTGGGGASRPVTGQGILAVTDPLISVTPSSLAFGPVPLGQTSQMLFTVTNVGGGTLTGTASLSAPGFTVAGGTYNLAAGQSGTVTISFTPTALMQYSGTVSFTGGGGASRLVTGSGIEASASPMISVTPTSLPFGYVNVGTSKIMTLLVTNIGSGILSGTATLTGSGFVITSGQSYNLTSGQSASVVVRFSPASAINYSGTVTFTGGGGASVSVTGTGAYVAPPAMQIWPDFLDFGSVNVGEKATRTFTVSNVGGGTLTGEANSRSDGLAFFSRAFFKLASGASTSVTVEFSPAAAQSYSSVIHVVGAGGEIVTVIGRGQLTGSPPIGPKIMVTPDAIDFGSYIGFTDEPVSSFTVSNIGTETLIGSASISGSADFILLDDTSYTLEPGQSKPIFVQFLPSQPYYLCTATVTFTGGGGATRQVKGSAAAATQSSPGFRLIPGVVNFGEVMIGETKTCQIMVRNYTSAAFDVYTNFGGLTYSFNERSFRLEAHQNRVITLRYHPQTLGPHNSTATFYCASDTTVKRTLSISGQGIGTGPEIQITPDELDFGHLLTGQTKTLSFTVTNTGGGTLQTLAFTQSPYSVLTSTVSLTAGQSAQFHVEFAPTAPGNFLKQITFRSTDFPDIQRNLTGSSSDPCPVLSVDPPSLDFGSMEIGQTKQMNFVMTNTGTAILEGSVNLLSGSETFRLSPLPKDGTLRVVTIAEQYNTYGVWRAYDVALNTGTKTLVDTFTDFSAFTGTNYQGITSADFIGSTMTYIGNDTLRVVTLTGESMWGTWRAYDVDLRTGAKTLVTTFTDFSAFTGTNYQGNYEADFIGSTMAYIGNDTLRVVTLTGESMWGTWRAYDVNLHTGAKTLVTTFTDFSAFIGTNYQGIYAADSIGSTMTYIGNDTLRVVTLTGESMWGTWRAYDVNLHTGAKTLVSTFTDFSAFTGVNYQGIYDGDFIGSTMAYIPPPENEFTLDPGQSATLTVKCTPQSYGPISGLVGFVSNGGNLERSLFVYGGSPGIGVSPGYYDYGEVTLGKSADTTFTVRNTGSGQLIGTISSSDPNFEIQGYSEFRIGAGQQMYVTVSYVPKSPGAHTGHITFASNVGTVTVPVTGNGAVKRRVRLIK